MRWKLRGGIELSSTLTDIKMTVYSPYCSPYISYGTSKENLSKYQDILSLVITFFILFTRMCEQVLITKREISFLSLLVFQGLNLRSGGW